MSTDKQCILVIEDHEPLLFAIRDLLANEGFTVLAALSGADALSVLDEDRPDLIIADIMMPKMDGYALLEAVRARPGWASIPFAFLTARTDKEHRLKAREMGIESYITKPLQFVDLLETVRSLLEESARSMEQPATGETVTLRPTEADVDMLLNYIWRDIKAEPPVLDSVWLCGQPARWDLSLLRSDQVEALETAANIR